ncbi:MAG: hypothetical protein IJE21_07225 [Alistipes sp.]|nr:hypothetical protein [Alistipes sp.]
MGQKRLTTIYIVKVWAEHNGFEQAVDGYLYKQLPFGVLRITFEEEDVLAVFQNSSVKIEERLSITHLECTHAENIMPCWMKEILYRYINTLFR